MRGRFRPQDGQLYVCGLRGWQTAGGEDGGLQRVRYTGKPVLPCRPTCTSTRTASCSAFTCPLDQDAPMDPDSYSILQWNYKWAADYGSRQWSVADPTKQGYDEVKVKSAKLLPDGQHGAARGRRHGPPCRSSSATTSKPPTAPRSGATSTARPTSCAEQE